MTAAPVITRPAQPFSFTGPDASDAPGDLLDHAITGLAALGLALDALERDECSRDEAAGLRRIVAGVTETLRAADRIVEERAAGPYAAAFRKASERMVSEYRRGFEEGRKAGRDQVWCLVAQLNPAAADALAAHGEEGKDP